MVDTRVGNNRTDPCTMNRGAIRLSYGNSYYHPDCYNSNPPAPDVTNNGNITRADSFIPLDVNNATWVIPEDTYQYDALNRITQVSEIGRTHTGGATTTFTQNYSYDRWGNMTASGFNATAYTPNTATNRLEKPGQAANACTVGGTKLCYDNKGNLVEDSYTYSGSVRQYGHDAENRMLVAFGGYPNSAFYLYNAEGQRLFRQLSDDYNKEYWQVYGLDGELVAEYTHTYQSLSFLMQKEFGYRNGQMLVMADTLTVKWLVQDHLGTARMILDASGGVYVTTDDGANWKQIITGLTNLRLRAITIKDNLIFVGTEGSGVFNRPVRD